MPDHDKPWPSRERMREISDAALSLSQVVRANVRTTDPDAPVRRPFHCASDAPVHQALDVLDYLFHGRSLENYFDDRERSMREGWWCSVLRWAVGVPGPHERPELADELGKRPPNYRILAATDTWRWPNTVQTPYHSIFRAYVAIKYFCGCIPIFSINHWVGNTTWLREEILSIPFFGPALRFLDAWVPEGWCRNVMHTNGAPAELGVDVRGPGCGAVTDLPIEWLDALEGFAGELRAALKHLDRTDMCRQLPYVLDAADSGARLDGPRPLALAPPDRVQKDEPRSRRKDKVETSARLVAGLSIWHRYRDGAIERGEPATVGELAKQVKLSTSTVSRWFKQTFGGHANYKHLCRNESLVFKLRHLNGDDPAQGVVDPRLLDGERDLDLD